MFHLGLILPVAPLSLSVILTPGVPLKQLCVTQSVVEVYGGLSSCSSECFGWKGHTAQKGLSDAESWILCFIRFFLNFFNMPVKVHRVSVRIVFPSDQIPDDASRR